MLVVGREVFRVCFAYAYDLKTHPHEALSCESLSYPEY